MAHNMTRNDLVAKLEALLQQSIDFGVPGISAAISTTDGILWESTAGSPELGTHKPVTPHHVFGIGSITKVFVTVVILQLVEAKKLSLSDTVGGILDAGAYHNIDNVEAATLEQLLSHTAGIDSWEDDPAWIVNGRGRDIEPERIWDKMGPLDYIRRPRFIAPDPGRFYYANTNFTLLGLIVEKITNHTAEAEIRRRILEPLDMKHTYLEGFEDHALGTTPHRYHWATEAFRAVAGASPKFPEVRSNLIDVTGSNLSTEWTAGGIISSPPDLLKFAVALRDGGLLNQDSLAIMQDWRPIANSKEMGHGLMRIVARGGKSKWLGHFGSVLGFTGSMWWEEKADCAICVLANVGTVHAGGVPTSACEIITETELLDIASQVAASR